MMKKLGPVSWILAGALVLSAGAARAQQTETAPSQGSQQSDDQGPGPALDKLQALGVSQKTKDAIETAYQQDRTAAREGADQGRADRVKAIDDNYAHLADFLSKQPAGSMEQAAQKWLGEGSAQQKKVFDALNTTAGHSAQAISFDPEKGDFQFDKAAAGSGATSIVEGGSKSKINGKDDPFQVQKDPALSRGSNLDASKIPTAYPADAEGDKKPFKLNDTQKAGVVSGFWGALLFGMLMGPAGLIIGGGIAAAAGYAMAKQGSDDSGGGKKKSGGWRGGEHHDEHRDEHHDSPGSHIHMDHLGGPHFS